MEDKDGWECLEKHLLARLARAGMADLHGLGPRDECECVLNVAYRIGLREEFKGLSSEYAWEEGETQTWM